MDEGEDVGVYFFANSAQNMGNFPDKVSSRKFKEFLQILSRNFADGFLNFCKFRWDDAHCLSFIFTLDFTVDEEFLQI